MLHVTTAVSLVVSNAHFEKESLPSPVAVVFVYLVRLGVHVGTFQPEEGPFDRMGQIVVISDLVADH